jgi:hypothetical protein
MSVRLLKLSCGDLVIADVEDGQTGEELVINRPLRMVISDTGLALQMWVPIDLSRPMSIKQAHIIACEPVIEALANEYSSKFTNVVTPPSKKLVI